MENTGERYLPEYDGDWTLEHTHRYMLARELAKGKAVLDIACGDGYGSHMLAEVAESVVGVDIDLPTVQRAKGKYSRNGLTYVQGSAAAIPLADDSVDLVASFETIEHLAEHESMLREIRRVLRSGGLLIMSSPDKYEYSDITGYSNAYHVKELYRDEFVDLLQTQFSHIRMLGQRVIFGSLMCAEDDSPFVSWKKGEPGSRAQGLSNAEYLIALAGDAPLPALPSSVLKTPVEEANRVSELKGELAFANKRIDILEEWQREAREYIGKLEAMNHKLESQKHALHVRHDALDRELQGVYGSLSWRITSPLRSGKAFAKKMLRKIVPERSEEPVTVWPPDVRALKKKLDIQPYTKQSDTPLGVFLHIYYVDLAEELIACLRNLPDSARIHISTDTEEKKAAIQELFDKAGFEGKSEIRVCPNRGWDLAPFLVGFGDVIPRYPLILRLHSKRSCQLDEEIGRCWRGMLFSSLAGSPERVNAIMRAFDKDRKLGMVCPPVVAHNVNSVHFGGNFPTMQTLLAEHGIEVQPDTPIDFPVGSMFWCRSDVLSPWLYERFTYDDFAPTAEDERDGSLAHALERLFIFGCGITGFNWARIEETTEE